MLEQIEENKNKKNLVFIPEIDKNLKNYFENFMQNIIIVKEDKNIELILNKINVSKIKKIYLVGYDNFYDYLLPRLKKEIEVCWIFMGSFSDLSNPGKRNTLHFIFEYIDRGFVKYIGCMNKDNVEVFENAGYKCEYIDTAIKLKIEKYKESNSIGILGNDYDPNNNFYNQLASLKFVEYQKCKLNYVMKVTKNFIEYFNIKAEKLNEEEKIMSDNFVNLYVNFTNTNEVLVRKSFNLGVPCILGNTNMFDNNKYLKEHLVVKSDDDINEIAEKINFVKNNREKIIKEYQKFYK